MSYTELPYEFDLLWDIKTVEELYSILNGGMHCTDTEDWELHEMMEKYNIPLPEGHVSLMKPGFPTEVWIDNNGGYLTYRPSEEEVGDYQKMRKMF